MLTRNGILATAGVLGLAGLGVMAVPPPAQAWWGRGGVSLGIALPPVVVAPPYYARPPVAYYPPPPVAYYAPPRAWVPAHWRGGYWIPGHWR